MGPMSAGPIDPRPILADISLRVVAPAREGCRAAVHEEELQWRGHLAAAPRSGEWLEFHRTRHNRSPSIVGAEAQDEGRTCFCVEQVSCSPGSRTVWVRLAVWYASHQAMLSARRLLVRSFGFRRYPWSGANPNSVQDSGMEVPVDLRIRVICRRFGPSRGRVYATLRREVMLPLAPWSGLSICLINHMRSGPSLGQTLAEAAGFVSVELTRVRRAARTGNYRVEARLEPWWAVDPWFVALVAQVRCGFTWTGTDAVEAEPIVSSGRFVGLPAEWTLLEVPLSNGLLAYVQILPEYPRLGGGVRVLDGLFTQRPPVAGIQNLPTRFGPVFTQMRRAVMTGRWRIVSQGKPVSMPLPHLLTWGPVAAGTQGSWSIQTPSGSVSLGSRLPRSCSRRERMWLWSLEDLEYRILTGTSPNLERMRQFE